MYLAWSALFLSLGWNFWEYGLQPPGTDGIICGVVFAIMGAVPLLGLFSADFRRATFWSDAGERGFRQQPDHPTFSSDAAERGFRQQPHRPSVLGQPANTSIGAELSRLAELHAGEP